MPMAGVKRRPPRANQAFGEVRMAIGRAESRPFNDLPAIIRAFPGAIRRIVIDTTEHLGARAQELAPVQANPRPGDPTPGTLKESMQTSVRSKVFASGLSRGDTTFVGKVSFPAKDPRGHRYARPVESGSLRRRGRRGSLNPTGTGLVETKAQHFLLTAILEERPLFQARFFELEDLLEAGVGEGPL